MLIKPAALGRETLPAQEAEQDKKNCRRFGSCGVGEKAIFLGNYFLDRLYYIPYTSIQRVYKRVAMSKGGFTGKGVFGAIPYLVVEYDDGQEKQCTFKREEEVDALLACLKPQHPEFHYYSVAAEAKLAEREAARKVAVLPNLSDEAKATVETLRRAEAYLDKTPDLSEELSQSARRQRAQSISKPAYRYVALLIVAMGVVSCVMGVSQMLNHTGSFGVYFLLFGFAAIFMFAGLSMGPTARSNKQKILERTETAQAAMAEYIKTYPDFPLPARYAHPIVLARMRRAVETGRATTCGEALAIVKQDLQALNASVQVEQEEYDEVIAIKAMFLNADYE